MFVICAGSLSGQTPSAVPSAVAQIPDDILALPGDVHGRVFDKITSADETMVALRGSGVWCCLTLSKGPESQHWVMILDLLEDDPDKKQKDVDGSICYTTTGRSFGFSAENTFLRSTIHGPFSNPDETVPVRKGELTVNRANLGIGLHRVSGFFKALQILRERNPDGPRMRYSVSQDPVPEDPVLSDPELLEDIGLTPEVERAFVGSLPALLEFFGVVYETDGLKDILKQLIPGRSILGMLNPFGSRTIGFSYGNPQPYRIEESGLGAGLEAVTAIPVELQMKEKTVLVATLYAVDPVGPWEACAGVVALKVHPVKDPDKSLVIRFMEISHIARPKLIGSVF